MAPAPAAVDAGRRGPATISAASADGSTPTPKVSRTRPTSAFPKDDPVQFRYLLDDHRWENDDAADASWPSMGPDNCVVLTG
ncbi:MAG TPA: hypothetical protein VFZ70_11865 [Euzebyales bacterium]